MKKIILAALICWAACVSAPVYSQKVLVEKVVAVVEGEPIFLSDLQQMVKQYLLQRDSADLTSAQKMVIEQQALNELISNKLVLVQAKKLGLDVPFSEVEKKVGQVLEDNKKALGGEEGFEKQLKVEGLTIDELKQLYREQIKNRMLTEKVLASELDRSKMQVSEKELEEAYVKRKEDLPKRPAVVHLASMLFAFKNTARAKDEALRKIGEIRSKIVNGLDFSQAAKEYSEDPSSELGGDLGFLSLADVQDKRFADAASRLKVGEVSQPVLTSYGYHIIKMIENDEDKQEVHLKHILVRVVPDENDISKVFERAEDVHKKLLAGALFDSLASAYSDDSSAVTTGGDLGWLKEKELPKYFQDVLEGMKVGDISPVLRESAGFRIVKLIAREPAREYRYDEVKEELRKILQQDKMNTAIDDYISELHKKFYVDIRR
jgi:peptidyl-prolyl cis-trans isomerase SurA